MAKRIGEQTYEVSKGVIVMPIRGENERQDGWQVIVDGEYYQDFMLKRTAIYEAQRARGRIRIEAAERYDDFSQD